MPESQDANDLAVPSGWTRGEDQRLRLAVETKDFMSAVGLINEIAMVAEGMDHHPDLHLTGYRHLEIVTYSHDVGRLTERDVDLAERIGALLAAKGIRPS